MTVFCVRSPRGFVNELHLAILTSDVPHRSDDDAMAATMWHQVSRREALRLMRTGTPSRLDRFVLAVSLDGANVIDRATLRCLIEAGRPLSVSAGVCDGWIDPATA